MYFLVLPVQVHIPDLYSPCLEMQHSTACHCCMRATSLRLVLTLCGPYGKQGGNSPGTEAAPARRLEGGGDEEPFSTADSGPLAGGTLTESGSHPVVVKMALDANKEPSVRAQPLASASGSSTQVDEVLHMRAAESQEKSGNMHAGGYEERQNHGDQTEKDGQHEHDLVYDQDAVQGANTTENASQQNDRPEQQPSSSRERFLGADQQSEAGTAQEDGGLSEDDNTLETAPSDAADVSQQGQATASQQQMPEASQQQELTGDTSDTLLPEGHVAGSQPTAQAASDQPASDAALPTGQDHHAAQSVGHTTEPAVTQAGTPQQTQQVQQTQQAQETETAPNDEARPAQQTEALPVETAQYAQQSYSVPSDTAGESSSATDQQDGADSNRDRVQDASAQQQQQQQQHDEL